MENSQDLSDWTNITMSNMVETVSSFFDYSEQIVVGVSGGADSMTLLHCLYISDKNFQLIAAHLNHNLRGKESDEDQEFVRSFCFRRGIRFVLKSVYISKIARHGGISVELCGRNERYRFFEQFGCRIATAHTLSDRVETMLLNISRGAGLKGICSIPRLRGKIVRPLLSFSRDEIEAYCRKNSIEYRNDSTNFSDEYTRNKIRHHIVPEFKRLNSCFEKHVLNMFDCLEKDEKYLSQVAKTEFDRAFVEGGLKVSHINKLDYSIKIRVLSMLLKDCEIFVTNEMLIRILNICENMAVVRRGRLFIEKIFNLEPFDVVLPKKTEFVYKNLLFIRCNAKQCDYFAQKTKYLFLFKADYDKIVGDVHIRSRREGDRLKLPKRPTKKLKSLLQEKRASSFKRSQFVVLADDNGPFWARGFGLDSRALLDKNSKNVLLIFELFSF